MSPPLPRSTGLLWVWWGLYEGSDIVAGLAWAVAAARIPTGPVLTDAEAVSITAGFCAAFGAKLVLQGASAVPAIAIVRRSPGRARPVRREHGPAASRRSPAARVMMSSSGEEDAR